MHDNRQDDALADIDERLKALRQRVDSENGKNVSSAGSGVGRMMWLAFNVTSELIAGVLCGLAIGYFSDRYFETRPLFLCVFLPLGGAAGVLNAVRFVQRYEKRMQERPQSEQNGGKQDGMTERVGTDRTI